MTVPVRGVNLFRGRPEYGGNPPHGMQTSLRPPTVFRVPSAALQRWSGARASNLAELLLAHQQLVAMGTGRRYATRQLNFALIVRLASEFQGFARDLHDETAILVGEWSHPTDPRVAQVISSGLAAGRQLDRANATPETLTADFGRFGMQLWPALASQDRRTSLRRSQLAALNAARNALAHDDAAKLATLQARSQRLDLRSFKAWRGALGGLATTMDIVVSDYLGQLFGRPAPW